MNALWSYGFAGTLAIAGTGVMVVLGMMHFASTWITGVKRGSLDCECEDIALECRRMASSLERQLTRSDGTQAARNEVCELREQIQTASSGATRGACDKLEQVRKELEVIQLRLCGTCIHPTRASSEREDVGQPSIADIARVRRG